VQEPPAWHPAPRSLLTLDASTAAVVSWEPFAVQNLGRRLRSWVRPLHTGEAAGVVGQPIMGLASTGGAFLVCTGVALAWRRFRGWTGASISARVPRSLSDNRQQVTGSTRASQPRSTTHGGWACVDSVVPSKKRPPEKGFSGGS
jgi:uncharacterized iron-regulated membrane protein